MSFLVKDYDRKYFIVNFDYNHELINAIRLIPGRKYLKSYKSWLVPKVQIKRLDKVIPYTIEQFPKIHNKILALNSARIKIASRKGFTNKYSYLTDPYPFQKLVTRMALSIPSLGLFLDCGLGKSKIAIDIFNNRFIKKQINRVLIVCPLSVINVWVEEELPKHSLLKFPIFIVYGTKKKRLKILNEYYHQENSIALINYQGLASVKNTLLEIIDEKTILILDEAHLVKNTKSHRCKIVLKMSDLTDYKLELTGTPITRDLFDIFSLYYILDGGEHLGESFWNYQRKYFYSDPKGWWWKEKEGTKDYIHNLLQMQTITLKKDVVAKDLPKKIYEIKYCYLSNEEKRIYSEMKKNLIAWISENEITKANVVIAQLTRLSQITNGFTKTTEGKIVDIGNSKLTLLNEVIESIGDYKIIVWSRFRHTIEQMKNIYKDRAITYYGEDSFENIQKFKTSDIQILLSTIAKGGTGLSLDEADYSIYIDNSYNLQLRLQSEERFHRITSTRPKIVIDIVVKDTIDEIILKNLKDKKDFADWLLKDKRPIAQIIEEIL